VVFHMAAPDSSINNHQLQYSVNVQGLKKLQFCKFSLCFRNENLVLIVLFPTCLW